MLQNKFVQYMSNNKFLKNRIITSLINNDKVISKSNNSILFKNNYTYIYLSEDNHLNI